MSNFFRRQGFFGAVMLALLVQPHVGHAAEAYTPLAPACLPERAEPWREGVNQEHLQKPCHCPPPSFCPATAAEWSNMRMPPELAIQCCQRPVCPPGTALAGEEIPANGQCNPPLCPEGTDLAGRPVPPSGDCNEDCPNPMALPTIPSTITGRDEVWSDFHGANIWVDMVGTYATSGPDYCQPRLRWYRAPHQTVPGYNVVVVNNCLVRMSDERNPRTLSPNPGTATLTATRPNNESCEWTWRFDGHRRQGCILAGTKITLFDGTEKLIEDVKLGDTVRTSNGSPAAVSAINDFNQEEEEMYGINGGEPFFTKEHPILTTKGWKAIDPAITNVSSDIKLEGKLEVGDQLVLKDGLMEINSIDLHKLNDDRKAYNLNLIGTDKSFVANGFTVRAFNKVKIHY